MKGLIPHCLLAIFLATSSLGFAQEEVEIPPPSISLKEGHLHIAYDILNSRPSELFMISLEVRDEQGSMLRANALRGDIGKDVSGGSHKTIIWDLAADQIKVNTALLFTIYAERVPVADDPEPQISEEDHPVQWWSAQNGMAGTMLQSALFPGLGLSRLTGKPHWIKGAAAYGCLGGAIVLNRRAISNYDKFLLAESPDEADELYSKSSRQDATSEVLAYSALGIWITDLVWTWLSGSRHHKQIAGPLKFKGGYDWMTFTPTIGLVYSF